ncbi:MAG: efflux RND transporter periplasmic adaptor subunit [Candidatus Riflebacteria bacterium]|nr:efflux RND transporter periplasmic adaptor subunit [Candidatus Riflebacteria bacterium]
MIRTFLSKCHLGLFLILTTLLFISQQASAAPQTLIAAVVERNLVYEAVGTIQPRMTTTLSSKVTGNVLEVLKREGDSVSAGEILVKIDARDLASDLAGAKAGLSEAAAGLSELDRNRQGALANKEQVLSSLKLAESNFQRTKELFDKKSVSRQEFDQAQAQLDGTRAQLKAVEAQINGIEATRSRIGARMNQAQAGISKVETVKGLAEVAAPFSGRVTARKIEPGMLAAPGIPLLMVEDDSNLRLEAIIPESMIASISEGQVISVGVDALGSDFFNGTVAEIVPAADMLSHTFIVKISLPNHPRLRSGMYARGRFIIGSEPVLLVTRKAVEERGQLEGIWTPNETGRPAWRLIRTGRTFEDQIEVLSGLASGETYLSEAPGEHTERK